VGTVHIALSHAGGIKERGALFPGDREAIRWHASQLALDMGASISFITVGSRRHTAPKVLTSHAAMFVALRFPLWYGKSSRRCWSRFARSRHKLAGLRPENLHVTPNSFGEVAENKTRGYSRSSCARALRAAGRRSIFTRTRIFPDEKHPEFSGGYRGFHQLKTLATDVDGATEQLASRVNSGPFCRT